MEINSRAYNNTSKNRCNMPTPVILLRSASPSLKSTKKNILMPTTVCLSLFLNLKIRDQLIIRIAILLRPVKAIILKLSVSSQSHEWPKSRFNSAKIILRKAIVHIRIGADLPMGFRSWGQKIPMGTASCIELADARYFTISTSASLARDAILCIRIEK